MDTVIMFANSVKEAKQYMLNEYSDRFKYIGVYKYSKGKGNNFYKFIFK